MRRTCVVSTTLYLPTPSWPEQGEKTPVLHLAQRRPLAVKHLSRQNVSGIHNYVCLVALHVNLLVVYNRWNTCPAGNCGHDFCRSCLDKWRTSERQHGREIRCPVCRGMFADTGSEKLGRCWIDYDTRHQQYITVSADCAHDACTHLA